MSCRYYNKITDFSLNNFKDYPDFVKKSLTPKFIWFYLDEKGFISFTSYKDKCVKPLKNKGGVYIYQSLLDINKFYIGSAVNIAQRFRQHRYRINVSYKPNSIFYNYITKYGWNNIRFGVLEYIEYPADIEYDLNKNKLSLLNKEQYYLDKFLPTLNINKFAGSMLGFKHTEEAKLKFSRDRRGKTRSIYTKDPFFSKDRYPISKEKRLKLKLNCRGLEVNIYNKDKILINSFPTIRKAANFVGLSPSSVSKYIKSGLLWCDLYTFKAKQ